MDRELIDDRRGWSIKKEINVGEIVYAIVILLSMVLYVGRIDTKTELNSKDIAMLRADAARQDAQRQLSDQQHREDINRLGDKLDHILDLLSKR
ncbi:MAG: hypothetical protein JSS77_16005 [Acidobacteria bacterium]|nr:hypothetical protein [Acidobacteriota bacterium]